MATRTNCLKPVKGMIVALRNTASETFSDIPARVINIWPPFKSGDCLLTLEYAQPVKINNQLITHIDVFASEVYQPSSRERSCSTRLVTGNAR